MKLAPDWIEATPDTFTFATLGSILILHRPAIAGVAVGSDKAGGIEVTVTLNGRTDVLPSAVGRGFLSWFLGDWSHYKNACGVHTSVYRVLEVIDSLKEVKK